MSLEPIWRCTVQNSQTTAATHKQVLVRVGDRQDEVDAGIAPLIAELWRAGIGTWMSCEDNDGMGGSGKVWIVFDTPDDAAAFLNIVASSPNLNAQSLYSRINDRLSATRKCWEYEAYLHDLELEDVVGGDEYHNGEPCFDFSISIRFPHSDYARVLARMRKHNGHARTAGDVAWEPTTLPCAPAASA
jgi:hypothetical protein